MTNEDLIRFCYEAVLNREPEPEMIAHWEGVLATAEDAPARMFSVVFDSSEGQTRFEQYRSVRRTREKEFAGFEGLSRVLEAAQIIDIGAAAIETEPDIYEVLIQDDRWHVIGFEPRAPARAERQASLSRHNWLPDVIGDGTAVSFSLNTGDLTSSTFGPNAARIGDFEHLVEEMESVGSATVSTTRLDDIRIIDQPAFLKIDVQGGEANVLAGARNTLAESLVVQLEVEFFPVYADQPLFADIDPTVRDGGFEFFTFARLQRYLHRGDRMDTRWRRTRVLWGDAVYVAGRARVQAMDLDRLAALCWIMHDVYHAYDYCMWALGVNESAARHSLADSYWQYMKAGS